MKFIIFLFLLVFFYTSPLISSSIKIIRADLPFDKSNLQSSYLLDNGKEIYIEQFERGDRIWEYNSDDQIFKEMTFVWNFIALAKNCEGIKEKNIYFANPMKFQTKVNSLKL